MFCSKTMRIIIKQKQNGRRARNELEPIQAGTDNHVEDSERDTQGN